MSPKQPNKEFWEQKTRTLLGIGIYYLEPASDEIKIIHVDIVSDFTTSAMCAIRCFRLLREQPFFKRFVNTNWIVWSDCGSHFRCSELMHYFFVELFEEKILINLNFFAERHGKNSRDQHFSAISKCCSNIIWTPFLIN